MQKELLALAISALCGCEQTTSGARRSSGMCPAEPCSPAAPVGLEFRGPAFGDADWLNNDRRVKTLAVSGTEWVQIDPIVEFEAMSSSDGLRASSAGGSLFLRAMAEGSFTVSLLDANDGALLDRLSVAAKPIGSISARYLGQRLPGDPPFALARHRTHPLIIDLKSSDDWRLVDQGMSIETSTGSALPVGWDTVEVALADERQLELTVVAGDASPARFLFPIARDVEAIVAVDDRGEVLDGPLLALEQELCFAGLSEDGLVLGLQFEFEIAPELSVITFDDNCIYGLSDEGDGPLVVRAGDLEYRVWIALE